ncbi:MAG: hypothetical protein R3F50_00990 [Gammaproteobacteria bacterium]|jgi:hypothetical protein
MSLGHLSVAIILLGLFIYRFFLSAAGKSCTRLLTVALGAGLGHFGLQAFVFLFSDAAVVNSLLLVAETLYVLFFMLLALHYTNRNLPVLGYWVAQLLVYLALLTPGILVFVADGFDTPAYTELVRSLLLLSATLAFVTINRSPDMLNTQPVFWIPTLIVATGYSIATFAKVISTLVHFSGSGYAGLAATISSLLGAVATLLLLIFLAANISWFRKAV